MDSWTAWLALQQLFSLSLSLHIYQDPTSTTKTDTNAVINDLKSSLEKIQSRWKEKAIPPNPILTLVVLSSNPNSVCAFTFTLLTSEWPNKCTFSGELSHYQNIQRGKEPGFCIQGSHNMNYILNTQDIIQSKHRFIYVSLWHSTYF